MRKLEASLEASQDALQFVDTNVLIYAHDVSAGEKHTRTRELLQSLWHSEAGCLSVQVLQEYYVYVTREVAKPMARETAAQIIADLSDCGLHRPESLLI